MRHFETTSYKKYEQDYIKHRTRVILLERVLEELHDFDQIEATREHHTLRETRALYERLLAVATDKRNIIREQHPSILELEAKLIHHTIIEQESDEIEALIEHEIISKKI